jgi:hypothetical protein
VHLKRRGRGNACDGLLSATWIACVRDSLRRIVCTRREIHQKKERSLLKKREGNVLAGCHDTRGCGVCKGASTCLWRVATVVV